MPLKIRRPSSAASSEATSSDRGLFAASIGKAVLLLVCVAILQLMQFRTGLDLSTKLADYQHEPATRSHHSFPATTTYWDPDDGGGRLAQAMRGMAAASSQQHPPSSAVPPHFDASTVDAARTQQQPTPEEDYQRFVVRVNDAAQSNSNSNNVTDSASRFVASSDTVVVFICNQRYSDAVLHSIQSLRSNGGYTGDVAVILEEESDGSYTTQTMYQRLPQFGVVARSPLSQIVIYSVTELVQSLFGDDDNDAKSNLGHLKEPPPMSTCFDDRRKAGYTAYYRKLLSYHPTIALQWKYVLRLDACMTFHLPYVDKLFALSRTQHPHAVLAALDLYQWRYQGIQGQLLSTSHVFQRSQQQHKANNRRSQRRHGGQPINATTCQVNKEGEALVHYIVTRSSQRNQHDLESAMYFASTVILYDSTVIRNYRGVTGSSTSTLVEMMQLYHQLAGVFRGGDQMIQSIYWMYLRDPSDFAVWPQKLWNEDEHALTTYTFAPPVERASHRASWTSFASHDPMPIMTAFNLDRPICAARSVNAGFYDKGYQLRSNSTDKIPRKTKTGKL